METKKQTAVEWLMENLHLAKSPFEQAKAMEKEQIIDAYRDGRSDQHSKERIFYNRNAVYYYTSTYGQ
jgi:hypothetical protein